VSEGRHVTYAHAFAFDAEIRECRPIRASRTRLR
jgi:hypothetical protein